MLMPKLFGENLLDDFFEMPNSFRSFKGVNQNIMSTDIKDTEHGYEINMNLPGYKKDDVNATLKNGYITINAVTDKNNDVKDENGKFIRKERFSGSCTRSFYVGSHITEEDIKAKFEDGVLKLTVPKMDARPTIEDKHYIAIEG